MYMCIHTCTDGVRSHNALVIFFTLEPDATCRADPINNNRCTHSMKLATQAVGNMPVDASACAGK